MHQALPKNVYRVSWAILFGQLVFAISVVAVEFLVRYGVLADDYWLLYTAPFGILGIGAGWVFANRSTDWRRFNIFCAITGGVLTPIFLVQAIRYYQKSVALQGTGFLAGLGELVTAFICAYFGIATLSLFIAGSATTFNGWRFSLRTLLIAVTLLALTLGTIFATI
jgi:hypothetical protein